MARATKQAIRDGFGFGLVAGIVFAIMEVVGAAMMGNPPLMPLRMFASVVLGRPALESLPLGAALVVDTIAHLALSGGFGAAYGLASTRLTAETRGNWGRQAGFGLAFGVALWLVNFQVVARFFYPWFLGAPQLLQAMMHAVFFGLPLALMSAASERRGRSARLTTAAA